MTNPAVNTARLEITVDRGQVSIDGDIEDINLVFKMLGAAANVALEYQARLRQSAVLPATLDDLTRITPATSHT